MELEVRKIVEKQANLKKNDMKKFKLTEPLACELEGHIKCITKMNSMLKKAAVQGMDGKEWKALHNGHEKFLTSHSGIMSYAIKFELASPKPSKRKGKPRVIE